ncbi:MAG TPA: endonuclease/exonuclease/phosphatase family protein [Candidatus Limnocylindrales bacterium]|nr:endonuclease/exonuclease/phosphatase family protein [Candidatus Limnocylindrales bacterium]
MSAARARNVRTDCGALALLLAMVAGPAAAATKTYEPCPDASYVLSSGAVFEEDATSDTITVEDGTVSLGDSCPGSAAAKLRIKAGRTKTVIRAAWDACAGKIGKVRLKLAIDRPTCERVTGKIGYRDPSGVTARVPVAATADVGDSIRIGAFNVQFLPSTVFQKPLDHADKIAKRIVESGYDFIVLSEVFDDEAGERFRELLGNPVSGRPAHYPHHISELDGDTVLAEQSGLAIFSKFPFINVLSAGCDGSSCDGDCIGSACGNVVFLTYHECDDTAWPWDIGDCDADKGMAYARLRNPVTGTVYSVLWTHTQASYPGADTPSDEQAHVETRKQQLGLAGYLLNNHRPADGGGDQVFLMGDLNIDGNLAQPNLGNTGDAPNRYEFDYHFTQTNDFFQGYFLDPWQLENSPSGTDPGLTNMTHYEGNAGARLDYIARHAPNSPQLALPGGNDLCFQHMTVAYNLFWSDDPARYRPKGMGLGGEFSLSDHFGVNADINRWAPQCRPADAAVIAPAPGVPTTFSGEIQHPGGMQWWRVDSPGSHSIAILDSANQVVTDDFIVTMYRASDLSTPINPYRHETSTVTLNQEQITASRHEILQPPYYLRVSHRYRTQTGPYRLLVLRHDCASLEQSCALRPALFKDHVLPNVFQGRDEAWFDLETDALPAGVAPQGLQFLVDRVHPDAAGLYTLRLYDTDGLTQLGETSAATDEGSGLLTLRLARSEDRRRKMFLTVTRASRANYAAGTETDFSIGWTSNLSILFANSLGVTLQAVTENDDISADDEIRFSYVRKDGVVSGSHTIVDEDFEAGEVANVAPLLQVPNYFYDEVQVRFLEDDDTSGSDILDFTIDALLPTDTQPLLDTHQQRSFDTGGDYVLRYSVGHYLPD